MYNTLHKGDDDDDDTTTTTTTTTTTNSGGGGEKTAKPLWLLPTPVDTQKNFSQFFGHCMDAP